MKANRTVTQMLLIQSLMLFGILISSGKFVA
jgi:hypothetical protein